MVEQTKDSTFTEYGLAHGESGLLNSDKQLSSSVAAKKSALQDSHNENSMTVSKPVGNPPKVNAGGGHIVYVRRKPETELAKNQVCETKSGAVDCDHLRKPTEQGEGTQRCAETNEPMIGMSDIPPIERPSSPSFSSTRRSVSPSRGMSANNISSPRNANDGRNDCVDPSSNDAIAVNVRCWEERYRHLQSLLKTLDQSDQDDYVKMLRSLSSVELSQHALELEKRSIKLSLEEARELQRVGMFDVVGKYPKNMDTPHQQKDRHTQN